MRSRTETTSRWWGCSRGSRNLLPKRSTRTSSLTCGGRLCARSTARSLKKRNTARPKSINATRKRCAAADVTKGVFQKRGRAIFPVDQTAEEMLLALPDKNFIGEFYTARNPRQHSLWWAMMTFLAEHHVLFDSKEHASEQIKLDTGHFYRCLNMRTGELREKTKSIAFESLAQKDFNDLFQRAREIICREYVPGLDSEVLREEIESMVDGPERASLGKRIR